MVTVAIECVSVMSQSVCCCKRKRSHLARASHFALDSHSHIRVISFVWRADMVNEHPHSSMQSPTVLLACVLCLPTTLAALSPTLEPPNTPATARAAASPLDTVVDAALAALEDESCLGQGKERDGSWCAQPRVLELQRSLRGLRGRKLAWWLDAPRPLRSVTANGARHEVSIVALPGASMLPAAAYPAGSVILVQPLLGQIECRRVRIEPNAPSRELMRRTLKHTDACMNLVGGACHEWYGTAGVASAFLQVVLLGPNSRFPESMVGSVGLPGAMRPGALGWATPPAEGCESNADLVTGATIGCSLDDLLALDRPSSEQLSWEKDPSAADGSMPDDAPALLRRLQGRVGGLDGQMAEIVRRALASRLYPPAITRELGLSPVRGMLLYGPPGCGKSTARGAPRTCMRPTLSIAVPPAWCVSPLATRHGLTSFVRARAHGIPPPLVSVPRSPPRSRDHGRAGCQGAQDCQRP